MARERAALTVDATVVARERAALTIDSMDDVSRLGAAVRYAITGGPRGLVFASTVRAGNCETGTGQCTVANTMG
jgi:hypothetical protein